MKKFLTWVSLGILLVALVAASISMGQLPPTYDGSKATVPLTAPLPSSCSRTWPGPARSTT